MNKKTRATTLSLCMSCSLFTTLSAEQHVVNTVICVETANNAIKENGRVITLAAESPTVFGRDIILRVSYQNHTASAWELKNNPTNSTEVYISRQRPDTGESQKWISLKNIIHNHVYTPDDGWHSVWETPVPIPLTIAAGERFDFEHPFRGFDPGGRHTIWIDDEYDSGLKSNRIEVQSILTRESVDLFLEAINDKTTDLSGNWYYIRRLEEIIPIKKRIYFPQSDVSDENRKAEEKEAMKRLDEYREYIANPTNTPVIQAAMDWINMKGEGLTVEIVDGLTNQAHLAEIAQWWNNKAPPADAAYLTDERDMRLVRLAAIKKLEDQEVLERIAKLNSSDKEIRDAVAARISEQRQCVERQKKN